MSKLGIVHYNTPHKELKPFLKWAAETGFKFVELSPPDIEIDKPSETLIFERAKQVRDLVKSYGLRVSAFAARNDFVVLDPDAVDHQVERMRIVAEVTKILDDEAVIRSEGGWEKPTVPEAAWGDAMYECFARCVEFAEQMDVNIAIDNHGTITNNEQVLFALLKRIDHPSIGANLDTMNFRWYGYDIATCNAIYEKLAAYVKHVHLKDGVGSRADYKGCELGTGEIDLKWALSCLRSAGYTGSFNAEYEGLELADGAGYAKCLAWMTSNISE